MSKYHHAAQVACGIARTVNVDAVRCDTMSPKDQAHLSACKKEAIGAYAAYYKDGDTISLDDVQYEDLTAEMNRFRSAATAVNLTQYGQVVQQVGLVNHYEQNGENIIQVSLKGTDTTLDMVADALATQEPCGEIGHAHAGILATACQIYPLVYNCINSVLQQHQLNAAKVKFVFTGHSLGGGLATIISTTFKAALLQAGIQSPVELVTFNSPRVFDVKAAAHANDLLDKALRFYREGDPVSMLPLSSPTPLSDAFKHVGAPCKLSSVPGTFYIGASNHDHKLNVLEAHSLIAHQEDTTAISLMDHIQQWISR